MRWLRRIGLVLLVLAILLVAWEPTRVGLQTAVMLPNLLDAGPKPLEPVQRGASTDGRAVPNDRRGAEPSSPSCGCPRGHRRSDGPARSSSSSA